MANEQQQAKHTPGPITVDQTYVRDAIERAIKRARPFLSTEMLVCVGRSEVMTYATSVRGRNTAPADLVALIQWAEDYIRDTVYGAQQ